MTVGRDHPSAFSAPAIATRTTEAADGQATPPRERSIPTPPRHQHQYQHRLQCATPPSYQRGSSSRLREATWDIEARSVPHHLLLHGMEKHGAPPPMLPYRPSRLHPEMPPSFPAVDAPFSVVSPDTSAAGSKRSHDEAAGQPGRNPGPKRLKRVDWMDQFKALVEFKDLHGHCNVPKEYDASLYRWLHNQKHRLQEDCDPTRTLKDEGTKSKRRFLLETIGVKHVYVRKKRYRNKKNPDESEKMHDVPEDSNASLAIGRENDFMHDEPGYHHKGSEPASDDQVPKLSRTTFDEKREKQLKSLSAAFGHPDGKKPELENHGLLKKGRVVSLSGRAHGTKPEQEEGRPGSLKEDQDAHSISTDGSVQSKSSHASPRKNQGHIEIQEPREESLSHREVLERLHRLRHDSSMALRGDSDAIEASLFKTQDLCNRPETVQTIAAQDQKLRAVAALTNEQRSGGRVTLPDEAEWQSFFRQLKEFSDAHGHCFVPPKHPEFVHLAVWLRDQRDVLLNEGSLGKLRDEATRTRRRMQLEALGIIFYHSRQEALEEACWQQKYRQLEAFKETFGHCIVPRVYPLNQELSDWFHDQLSMELNEDHINKNPCPVTRKRRRMQLESLGVPVKEVAETFALRCRQESRQIPSTSVDLAAVPIAYAPNQPQGGNMFPELPTHWPRRHDQRLVLRDGAIGVEAQREAQRLSPNRDQRSEKSDKQEAESQWWLFFGQLKKFKQAHGHCLVPSMYPPNQQLSDWLKHQRYEELNDHHQNRLQCDATRERRKRTLESIGVHFNIAPDETAWQQMFDQLVAFKAEHGNCRVPVKYPRNPSLAFWYHRQKHVKLSDDHEGRIWCPITRQRRRRQLESLGVQFDLTSEKRWRKKLRELMEFKETHGHCNVPNNYTKNPSLAKWLHDQRFVRLTEDHVERLDSPSVRQKRRQELQALGISVPTHVNGGTEERPHPRLA